MLKSNKRALRKLLDLPSTDVNCANDEGETLIMQAISSMNEGSLNEIEFLLKEKKADPNAANINGMTALHYAAGINPIRSVR